MCECTEAGRENERQRGRERSAAAYEVLPVHIGVACGWPMLQQMVDTVQVTGPCCVVQRRVS